MAYTYEQLTKAYAAVHGGIAPTDEVAAQLLILTNASFTDADRLNYILNSADDSTAVAVMTYQFFTGKSPKADGIAWLLNSADNPTDLSDPAFAAFNLEHRFMNFAASLALSGEGKAAFLAQYGALTYAGYVASIYDSIIGVNQARAAGLNPDQIIQDVIARQDLILASARAAGMIGPNATAADIDLALKTATAAYLLAEGIKADVGVYAAATNNFMLGLAKGDVVYNTDITQTYAANTNSGSSGSGKAVDNPPPVQSLPGAPPPPPEPEPEPEPELPAPPPPPSHHSFTLTTGADTFTGGAGDDTFTATNLTFGDNDVLDGGAGHDTLTITATVSLGNNWYSTPNNGTTGIETINIASNVGASAYIPDWADVTALNLTAAGGLYAGVNAATKVTATTTAQGFAGITVNGGTDVTVTSTGATTGAITIGSTGSEPTGDIVISRELTGNNTGGAITVTGGKTVSVTQTAATTYNSVQTNGAVTVNGSALTTTVTVKAPAAFTDGQAELTANSVTITDAAAADKVGTITKATIDGYTTATLKANALSTLSLAHGSGNITIDNASTLASGDKTTTLDLALNGVTGGVLDDADVYTTLNITTGATASTLANITNTALTTLNIAGGSGLTLASAAGMTGLTSVNITGAAGLTGSLTNGTLTSVDASGTTGNNTLTLNGAKTGFTGGSGADSITFNSTSISKSYNLGAGDDMVTFTGGSASVTLGINGGDGFDTLVMSGQAAFSISQGSTFATRVIEFERLLLTSSTGGKSINLANIGVQEWVTTSSGTGTFQNINSGGTLELTAAGTSFTLSNTAFAAGANDTMNLRLVNDTGAAVAYASNGITATGVETFNIISTDTRDAPTGTFNNTVKLDGNSLQTVEISGNAGLTLTAVSTNVTSLDASGITLGGFSWNAGALTAAATIKGSATGTNTITFGAATGGAVTYTGGTGDDVINGANGKNNVVSLGAGNNSYTGGTGNETITVGAGANSIDLGTGADTVNVTAANASSASVFTTITGFGADDKLTISAQGGAAAATSLGAKITGQASLAAYLDAASAGDGHSTARMNWFQFGGDTYVVLDSGSGATFTGGTDTVVKLAGAVDLTGSSVSNGTLTYAAPPVTNQSFTLTTGADTFTGDVGDDTFTGTHLTFSNGDALNGGAGADTLTITATAGATYNLPNASVTGIETLTVSNDAGLFGALTAWSGLTQVNTTSSGSYELYLPGAASLKATVNAQGANSFSVNNGKNLDLTIKGATTSILNIGGNTALTGALDIARETAGAVTAGAINVTGGTTISVTQTATNAVNTTQTNGAVTIHGRAATTEVTVKAAKLAYANSSTVGITTNTVTINDVNKGGASAGTITKASVDGYTKLAFNGSALTTLSLAHGSDDVTIDNSGGAATAATTLNLTVNGLTSQPADVLDPDEFPAQGVLKDSSVYTTLNITTGAEASRFADLQLASLTTLNIAGDSKLTLQAATGLGALQTVTVAGAASLVADLSAAPLTAVSTAASTGASTLTIDGANTGFTGGAGVDDITLSSSTANHALSLGGGDDVIFLRPGTGVPTVTIDGGTGTDTLKISVNDLAAIAQPADFNSKVVNFEVLYLLDSDAQTLDLGAWGYTHVAAGNANNLTLNTFAANGTLELAASGRGYTLNNTAFAAGSNDTVNLLLRSSSASAFAQTGVTANGVETINIQVDVGNTIASSMTLLGNDARTIVLTGNNTLELTATSTGLTSLDASGLTNGNFTWTSGAIGNGATVKGSAAGTNTVNLSAGGRVNYTGGAGADRITLGSNGLESELNLGGGNNTVTSGTGGITITAGDGNDTVTVGSGNHTVNLGNGTNAFTMEANAYILYTGGTGADTITVGNAGHQISLGGGADKVIITSAGFAADMAHASITGFGADDQLTLMPASGVNAATGSIGAMITGPTTLQGYLNAATAGDGSTTSIMRWFQLGTDTYVVLDNSANPTFQSGVDNVVKLVGLVDLNGWGVSGGVLSALPPPP